MTTKVHFINVGQGNMVLIQATDGKNFMFDCNITEENESDVLGYVKKAIGTNALYAFICSHRDSDHIKGIKKLHNQNPIKKIWDNDYPGTTTTSDDYNDYMDLRRKVGKLIIKKQTYYDYGCTRLRMLSSQDTRLASNPNAQGIVIKVEHRSLDKESVYSSTILTADSDAETWKDGILKDYDISEIDTDILMGGHHGSITFFDYPPDKDNYYTSHIRGMKPTMSVISVGPNAHGHPEKKALELYEKNSSGSDNGNKVFRTDKQGNMRLELKNDYKWSLFANQ